MQRILKWQMKIKFKILFKYKRKIIKSNLQWLDLQFIMIQMIKNKKINNINKKDIRNNKRRLKNLVKRMIYGLKI